MVSWVPTYGEQYQVPRLMTSTSEISKFGVTQQFNKYEVCRRLRPREVLVALAAASTDICTPAPLC